MKLLVTILILFISIQCLSQGFPIITPIGGKTVNTRTEGTFATTTGFTFAKNFSDTVEANSILYVKFTPGIVIRTGDTIFWVRNQATTYWTKISGGGSGGGGSGFTTANNGLTANTSTNVQLGGALTKDDTLFTTSSNYKLWVQNTSGTGLSIDLSRAGSGNGPGMVNLDNQGFQLMGFKFIGKDPGFVRNQVENTCTPAEAASIGQSYVSVSSGFSARLNLSGAIGQFILGVKGSPFVDSCLGIFAQGNAGIKLASAGAGYIRFSGNVFEGSGEYARFATTTGYLGLNTPNPTEVLTINGNERITALSTGTSSDSVLVSNGGVTKRVLQSSIIGATPTLQKIFDVEAGTAVMTSDNTIDVGSHEFLIFSATANFIDIGSAGGLTLSSPGGNLGLAAGAFNIAITSPVQLGGEPTGIIDTINNKPAAISNSGILVRMNSWAQVSGGSSITAGFGLSGTTTFIVDTTKILDKLVGTNISGAMQFTAAQQFTSTVKLTNTGAGTGGTDSVLVQSGGIIKKISPTYYSTGGGAFWALSGTSTITNTTTIDGAGNVITIQGTGSGTSMVRVTDDGKSILGDANGAVGGEKIVVDAANGLIYINNTVNAPLFGIGTNTPTVALDVVGNGQIAGNWIPATDNTYDLGSASFQWKDLYLTGSSIYMAGSKILATAGLTLPSSAIISFGGSNVVMTHTSGILTMGTGTLKISNPTNTSTSVVTIDGTQTLTNKSIAIGQITGLGTGVATALAVNVGSAGAFVTFNGALGAPSSGTLTNTTGYLWNNLTAPTADQALTFAAGFSSTWTNSNTTEDLFTMNTSTLTTSSMLSINSTSTALAAGNNLAEFVMSGANGSNAITATALRASVTNTNGTSGTNIALDATASGATTDNWAVNATGNIKITSANVAQSTTSSALTLLVNSLTTGTGEYIASSTQTSGNLLQIVGTSTALAANNEGIDIAISGANGTNAITATGIRSTVTNTNATSGTNIAALFTASGATTANIALQTGGGNVLIGSPTNNALDALIIQSPNNTAGNGLRIYANNNSTYAEFGYGAILNPGGFIIQSSSATVINMSGNNVFVGGSTTPTSSLHTLSFATGYVAKTANYTLTVSDHTVNCTANSFTITLPTAVGITGREYIIKNTGTATTITIATTSSQTIDGAVPGTVTGLVPLRVISDGANWISW